MFSNWITAARLKLAVLFRRRKLDRDLDDELQFHLAMREQKLIAGGMPATEAHFAARRTLGNSTSTKESARSLWTFASIESCWQDLRFAARMLRKNPGFTAVAILTLALGIGANTAIFSLVNGILLQPLPFTQPDRLVSITDTYPEGAFAAMRGSLKTMDVAAYRDGMELNLNGLGDSIRLTGMQVSANFFSLLGARPETGRTFVDGEDQPGQNNLVILSHGLWEEKFGSDPNAIGRSITLDAVNRQIVGVMPADFRFASPKTEFWIPLDLDPRKPGAFWGSGFMPVIARLRDGAAPDQARAEFRGIVPHLRTLFPWRMPDAIWQSSTIEPLQQSVVGEVQGKLLILLGAVGLVLIIACANAANLLLVRAATRQKEMALRAALGAGRWRICRQLLTESVLLSLGGGTLGLLLAINGLRWLKAILPAGTPRLASATLDWRVLAFTTALAVLTGVIFGLAPALHSSKIDLTQSLKSGGQGSSAAASSRLRDSLAVAEIAVAVVLVIGAGLLVKSLWELSHANPGFRTESILTARITPNANFCANFTRCQNFYRDLLARVGELPGVEAAATVADLPLDGRWSGYAAAVEDNPRDPKDPAPVIFESIITPDYLRILGIPLLRGRGFTDADMAPNASPVALVTAATAQKFWPNQDPIGKHLKPVFDKNWTTIVGLVADVNETSLVSRWPQGVDGEIYEPFGNGRGKYILPEEKTLVVKVAGAGNFADALRTTVAQLNPDVPVGAPRYLRTVVSESMAAPRSMTSLFAIFAALALALGAVGIYGVISYSVAQRTAEIGLRKALGAHSRDVMRLVMGQGVKFALWGVGIGLLISFALTRLMSSLLYGVGAADPLTYLSVSLLLSIVALLACYIPARRAARLDPLVALRHE